MIKLLIRNVCGYNKTISVKNKKGEYIWKIIIEENIVKYH